MGDFGVEKSYCDWNWLPIGLSGFAAVGLLPAFGFSLDTWSIIVTLGVVGALVGMAYAQRSLLGRTYWHFFFGFTALAQVILLTAIIAPLTYVAAALKFPMQDQLFAMIDLMVGFRTESFVAFVNDHPLIAQLLNFGYAMIRWPLFVIPIVLAATGRFLRLQQFMLAFIVTLIVTCVVSGILPAMGMYHYFDVPFSKYPNINGVPYETYIKDIMATLDGSLRHLSLLSLQGLVTFPSFHAASAVLYFWALMPVRFFGPLALVCNSLMLLGTPTVGGHYLIDIVFGVAGALAAIALAKAVTSHFGRGYTAREAGSSGVITTANSLS